MIYDLIENIATYKGLDSHLDLAIDSILSGDFKTQDPGRYELAGDKVFCFVQDNQLVEPGQRFEYHRNYADLHFLLAGQEMISYGYDGLEDLEPYQAQSDIGFVSASKHLDLIINDRYFAIFLPGEVHLPNQAAGEALQVRKIVYKILIE
ncbi:YhcH/YjgK/YiaL family protein [Streptococcus suis]|uniref:YhcH/YjgK/YiaL family protein n=1 Tax=Streptococcus suis TaxID=1307 RepID=UPI000CF39F3B|nr:YhcH/YjgK/YiaL family protein [Streptococcus suis]